MLAIPPLVVAGVAIHVGAWVIAARMTGCIVEDWRILPWRYGGNVYFGAVEGWCEARRWPLWQALAPSTAWILIATAGTMLNAWKGRTRRAALDRLMFITLLVLPLIALVMELSCAFTRRGSDGEELYAFRYLVAAGVLPLCAAFVAAGWFRFRAVFAPSLSPSQYAVGWTVLLALAAFLRQSATVWALIGRLAAPDPF
jgi:hypothetical protein